jgi:hypothetical protein
VGLDTTEMFKAADDDPRAVATRVRDSLVHVLGNLTIVNQALNSSVSNADWVAKKPELLKWSLLPINQNLHVIDVWDEKAIYERGRELALRTLELWPHPGPKLSAMQNQPSA